MATAAEKKEAEKSKMDDLKKEVSMDEHMIDVKTLTTRLKTDTEKVCIPFLMRMLFVLSSKTSEKVTCDEIIMMIAEEDLCANNAAFSLSRPRVLTYC